MTQITQLKCPSCGGMVDALPGVTRTTCSYCGADLAISLDRQEAMLYAIQQREASRERDRLAEERKQLYGQYMILYRQIGQIDADLRQREILQQTRIIRNQIAELYRRRAEVVRELSFFSEQIVKIDHVLHPELPTQLPVPATRRPPYRLKFVQVAAALFVLVVVFGALAAFAGGPQKVGPVAGFTSSEPTATQIPPTPDATIEAFAAAPPPVTGSVYAKETGHSVGAFAKTFTELGGIATLGYPITEAFVERDPQSGDTRWVQYFEKAVLEYHPELPDQYRYQLTLLGAWRMARKYAGKLPEARQLPGNDSQKFKETGFTVTGAFLQYWHREGELARFGYPISPPFGEQSEIDGKIYTVQYFERAVMEYHPSLSPPYNVQLTPIGTLKLKELYPDGPPMHAGDKVANPTP